jgi:dihydroxycyclohexadiene carboxylate dehydrogenase
MSNRQRFENKVVIVTGAAQGIGRGVALQVASEDAQVVMADLSPYVEEVLAEIEATGGDAITVKANLETFAGAQSVVEKALETYGRVDVLINNVGGAIWMKPFEEFSEEEIIKEVNRSLFPTLWCCRAVLPEMIKNQKGTIVNVSSIATRGINRVPSGISCATRSAIWSRVSLL